MKYPKNDACAGTKLTLWGLGPAGIPHLQHLDTVFVTGSKPFYVLLPVISSGCSAGWVTFSGQPQLYVDAPSAGPGTIYYMDVTLTLANTMHIPVGPFDERDPTHVRFDFRFLPFWAQEDGRVRIPLGPIIRIILGRQ